MLLITYYRRLCFARDDQVLWYILIHRKTGILRNPPRSPWKSFHFHSVSFLFSCGYFRFLIFAFSLSFLSRNRRKPDIYLLPCSPFQLDIYLSTNHNPVPSSEPDDNVNHPWKYGWFGCIPRPLQTSTHFNPKPFPIVHSSYHQYPLPVLNRLSPALHTSWASVFLRLVHLSRLMLLQVQVWNKRQTKHPRLDPLRGLITKVENALQNPSINILDC